VLSVCNWFAKILHEIGVGTSVDESRSTIDSLAIGVDLNDVVSVAQFAKETMRDERLNAGRR
jgi:hypothetical protein